MRLLLSDVARTTAQTLAGLPETDHWNDIRTRLRGIFGDDEGRTIADAVEAIRGTGRVSDVEGLILDQLHARVESTFALRSLTAELPAPQSLKRPKRAIRGPVVRACRDAHAQ